MENKTISKPIKSLFMKAYVAALDNIDDTEKAYRDALKQPQKTKGDIFLGIVIKRAIAKAEMEHLQDAFKEEGGGTFSFTN